MTSSPLLLLLSLTTAGAAPQAAGDAPRQFSAEDQSFLRANGFDPAFISPSSLPGGADRAGFVRDHQAAYERFTQWRRDPQAMVAADRRKPGSAQAALDGMSGFIAPREVGNLQAQLKLAGRGIKADVAAHGDAASSGDDGGSGPADEPSPTPSPAPGPTPGLHTSPPPGPTPQPAAPSKQADAGDKSWIDQAIQWACGWVACAKS